MWFLLTYGGGMARVRRLAIMMLCSSIAVSFTALFCTWQWHRGRCQPLHHQIIHNQQLLARTAQSARQPFSFFGSLQSIADQVRALPHDVVRAQLRPERELFVCKGSILGKKCLPDECQDPVRDGSKDIKESMAPSN